MLASINMICLGLLWAGAAMAQDKAAYDLPYGVTVGEMGTAKAAALGQQSVPAGYGYFANDFLAASLGPGGYFTLGTTAGADEGSLDDDCALTFGHPHALTSYPFFALDGVWYRLDRYPGGTAAVEADGDQLRIRLEDSDVFALEFTLVGGQGGAVQLRYRLRNLDDRPHSFGLGLMLDPALGKWGDGYLEGNEAETALVIEQPESLVLWERPSSRRGLGMRLDFVGEVPVRTVAANWRALHGVEAPDAAFGEGEPLYDLALKTHWQERPLDAGEEWLNSAVVQLVPPDFGDGPFLRWDFPRAFTLTDNRMFPRQFSAFVEVATAAGGLAGDEELVWDLPAVLPRPRPTRLAPMRGPGPFWRRGDIDARLVFEEQTLEAGVRLVRDGRVLDELRRRVWMPATPVSDTGLTVTVDSLSVENYPFVDLFFRAQEDATQRVLLDLADENIVLRHNGQEIADFDLGKDTSQGATAADIIFVLDVTSSMADEIEAVKENVIEFADSLAFRRIDFRLGLITFLDEIENAFPFTNDAQEFRRLVSQQFAHGGGDIPENSLDALQAAATADFRPFARRVVVWITDANYHQANRVTSLTSQQVIDAMLANDVVVNAVGDVFYKSRFYDPFTLATGGLYFDIEGNFRDILLELSRLGAVDRYQLTYRSPAEDAATQRVEVEVRYAGFGGRATVEFLPPAAGKPTALLKAFPNPFNPDIALRIDGRGYRHGEVDIFNVLGQRVRRLALPASLAAAPLQQLVWDGRDDGGRLLGAGLYVVRLSLSDGDGGLLREHARIFMLK